MEAKSLARSTSSHADSNKVDAVAAADKPSYVFSLQAAWPSGGSSVWYCDHWASATSAEGAGKER